VAVGPVLKGSGGEPDRRKRRRKQKIKGENESEIKDMREGD
jgi:hypothetical protein